jgi:hypothetical protein
MSNCQLDDSFGQDVQDTTRSYLYICSYLNVDDTLSCRLVTTLYAEIAAAHMLPEVTFYMQQSELACLREIRYCYTPRCLSMTGPALDLLRSIARIACQYDAFISYFPFDKDFTPLCIILLHTPETSPNFFVTVFPVLYF